MWFYIDVVHAFLFTLPKFRQLVITLTVTFSRVVGYSVSANANFFSLTHGRAILTLTNTSSVVRIPDCRIKVRKYVAILNELKTKLFDRSVKTPIQKNECPVICLFSLFCAISFRGVVVRSTALQSKCRFSFV